MSRYIYGLGQLRRSTWASLLTCAGQICGTAAYAREHGTRDLARVKLPYWMDNVPRGKGATHRARSRVSAQRTRTIPTTERKRRRDACLPILIQPYSYQGLNVTPSTHSPPSFPSHHIHSLPLSPWLLPCHRTGYLRPMSAARTAKPMTSSKRMLQEETLPSTPLTQMRRLKKRPLQQARQGRN